MGDPVTLLIVAFFIESFFYPSSAVCHINIKLLDG
jgi:hypothetical protein